MQERVRKSGGNGAHMVGVKHANFDHRWPSTNLNHTNSLSEGEDTL